jgi:hypothetical protein
MQNEIAMKLELRPYVSGNKLDMFGGLAKN